jgi:hypothetical protein
MEFVIHKSCDQSIDKKFFVDLKKVYFMESGKTKNFIPSVKKYTFKGFYMEFTWNFEILSFEVLKEYARM